MKIRTQLKIAARAPLVLALVVGLALAFSHRASWLAQQQSDLVKSVLHSINELNSHAASYMHFHTERPRQQFLDEDAATAEMLDAFHPRTRKQQQLLETVRQNTAALKAAFLQLVTVHEALPAPADGAARQHDEDLLEGQLLVRSRQAVADGLQLQRLVDHDMSGTQRTVDILVFLLILAVTIPLTQIVMRMMTRIDGQLATLHLGTEAIGRGNLAHRIGLPGADELADLARAFDQMSSRLQAVTVSKNELEREVEMRKRTQQVLQESEQRMQLALHVSHSFTFDWRPATDDVQRSASCAPILGVTGDEIRNDTGKHYFQRVHPDDRARFLQMIHDLTPAASHYAAEYRIVRSDGSVVVLEELAQAAFDPAGKLELLVGVATDITARHQAEAALRQLNLELEQANETLRASRTAALNLMQDAVAARRQAEQASASLQASEARYAGIVGSAMDAIVTVDANQRIVLFNTAAERMFRCRAQEMVGQSLSLLLPPDRRALHEQHVRAFAATGVTARQMGALGELVGLRSTGEPFPIEASISQNEVAGRKLLTVILRDVTARKLAEDAILRAKQEWERTFDTVPDLIAILDDQHRITRVNRSMARKLGCTPQELIGQPCFRVVHGCDAPPEECPHVKMLHDGAEHTAEVHEARLGGEYLVTTTPLKDAHGRMIGAVHVARDITEQRATQQREKEDAIRLAWGQSAIDTIDAMRDGVLLLEIDGTVTSMNPAVERLIGLHAGSAVGRNLLSILPLLLGEADIAKVMHWLKNLQQGLIPEMSTLLIRRQDGKSFHVLPSAALMDAPEGARQVIVATLKDVTELHEALHGLAQSERKYRELVENANSIIMRITPQHDITFFNEYAQTFFGYSAGEVLGRNVVGTIVPAVDSEGRDLRAMMRAITNDTEVHASNENENLCKDGRRVWVHWANRAVRDEQGHLVEILCVGTDVTRRREMQAEALRYQRRLRELAERLTSTEEEDRWRISRYVHDTIIQNLALSSIRLGSMVKPLTDAKLQTETDRLNQVRALLDQAIDECRMVMTDLTPALLYELGLIPALRDLTQQIEAKFGVRMIVEDGAEPPLSNALRGLLFQSVRELVMNTLKHAGPCEIRVTLSCEGGNLAVRVMDTGEGFDAASLELQPNGQGGFGLFNIRLRLEGLGGRLQIASERGKGTTATITMPLPAGEEEVGGGR